MRTPTFPSSEFNQHASDAKKAADQRPAFIIDRSRPTYVLLAIEDYRALAKRQQNIAALLAMPNVGDFELSIPPWHDPAKAAALD